jgi:hypothetical protein
MGIPEIAAAEVSNRKKKANENPRGAVPDTAPQILPDEPDGTIHRGNDGVRVTVRFAPPGHGSPDATPEAVRRTLSDIYSRITLKNGCKSD